MKFEFEYRRAYGKKYFYPLNSNARTLCECCDTATLMWRQMDNLLLEEWPIDIFACAPNGELALINPKKLV